MLKITQQQSAKVKDRRSASPQFLHKKACLDLDSFISNCAHPSTENLQNGTGKKKSVTFNEKMLVERFEYEDDDDSKLGRQLYWEFMAVDRVRFKDRIERLEKVLKPVLSGGHRNVVYTSRMSTEDTSFASQLVGEVAVVISSKTLSA